MKKTSIAYPCPCFIALDCAGCWPPLAAQADPPQEVFCYDNAARY